MHLVVDRTFEKIDDKFVEYQTNGTTVWNLRFESLFLFCEINIDSLNEKLLIFTTMIHV